MKKKIQILISDAIEEQARDILERELADIVYKAQEDMRLKVDKVVDKYSKAMATQVKDVLIKQGWKPTPNSNSTRKGRAVVTNRSIQ